MINAIYDLAKRLNILMSIKENGVDKKEFDTLVDHLAERDFEDQCTTANLKLPIVKELPEICRNAFIGK